MNAYKKLVSIIANFKMESKLKYLKAMPNPTSAGLPESYKLSRDQHQFYEDQGYLVLKELIDFTSLYSYKQRFVQICKGLVDKGNMTVVKELGLIETGAQGEDLINKVQDILYDDVFSQYTENPRLLNVVAQFIGENITGMHSMFINKPPGTSRHPPHQDLYYFPFRPADRIIAAWTAVDHVTMENGSLYVVPRSHKLGVIYKHDHLEGTKKMYHGIVEESTAAPDEKRVHLEMSPGDTVFFHPLLVHGSGPNVTKNYRKSISCHYAASDCEYIDVTGTVQDKIGAEIEAESKRRGFPLSFQDSWRYRSKQVRGVRSNL